MRRSTGVTVIITALLLLPNALAVYAEDRQTPSPIASIAWGKVVDGLQLGIFPGAATGDLKPTMFDGNSLCVNVQLRNTGKVPIRFFPSTFGCAAVGSEGRIPVTKLVLTPIDIEEPILITYQGHNHVSETDEFDADDLEYYTTELAPGESLTLPYLVKFTPGNERATDWQRTGNSNLIPDGKYRLKAVLVVDRKVSQWKGELTSGLLEVELHQ
jgi:hypothetical protein